MNVQITLGKSVVFDGVGLHSGAPVRMILHPAPAGHGIVFRRTDVKGANPRISARWDRVTPSKLCTLVENDDHVSVSTIEHIMAALAGLGITNALIEIDGPEVPILDGSSEPFVREIRRAGLRRLAAPLRAIRVLKPVEVREGEAVARLEPAPALEIDFAIDFADAAIGKQEKRLKMANGAFVRELMDSRTFCRQADVDFMRANGLALGGTYENAVVYDGDRVLSPGGLRHQEGAAHVDVGVEGRRLDRGTHAGLRREVHDEVDLPPGEDPLDQFLVPHVPFEQLEAVPPDEPGEVPFLDLPRVERIEVVQPDDARAARDERLRDVGADEPGGAGDEDRAHRRRTRGPAAAPRARPRALRASKTSGAFSATSA